MRMRFEPHPSIPSPRPSRAGCMGGAHGNGVHDTISFVRNKRTCPVDHYVPWYGYMYIAAAATAILTCIKSDSAAPYGFFGGCIQGRIQARSHRGCIGCICNPRPRLPLGPLTVFGTTRSAIALVDQGRRQGGA